MTLPTAGQERGETRIALPWPPSTNALFRNVPGHGRVATKEYKAWLTEAGWTLNAQHPPKFAGAVTVGIELCPPHGRAFDVDNRAKSCLDLLVKHRIIRDDNDSVVRSVSVSRVDNAAPCTVIVRDA